MKVLVYGANGWIGGQFISILVENNINFVSGKSRADNEIDLKKEIKEVDPSHVVSFIGRTHGTIGDKKYTTIDYLEEDGKLLENVRDNLFSPLLLAELCKRSNIHFTYLGTGCIFKYDEEHPFGKEENGFDEDDLPNFFGSSYSVVKGFTDRLMHLYDKNVLKGKTFEIIRNDNVLQKWERISPQMFLNFGNDATKEMTKAMGGPASPLYYTYEF
jgi:nucleoside-diphosphate-sugar epimerase